MRQISLRPPEETDNVIHLETPNFIHLYTINTLIDYHNPPIQKHFTPSKHIQDTLSLYSSIENHLRIIPFSAYWMITQVFFLRVPQDYRHLYTNTEIDMKPQS